MNKKATIQEIVMTMIMIFLAAIVFLTVKYSYGEVVTIMKNQTVFNESQEAKDALDDTNALTNRLDYIILTLLIGLSLVIIILGWFSSGHPIFAFIYFIALVIVIAISAIFSFVWEQVVRGSNTLFTITLESFPLTDFILSNFPVYITIIGFIGMMVMFAKPTFSQ